MIDTDCFCDYCGLPVNGVSAKPVVSPESVPRESIYCCLGCKLAAAVMRERDGEEGSRATLTRLGVGVFFAMNVMVFTLVLWSWDVYDINASVRSELLRELFRYACLVFAVPVLLLLGGPLFESTIADLRMRRLTTDALLSLGVVAAFGYSILSVIHGGRHIYFEVGSMILVAVTLGRWLEAQGKQQATRALSSLQRLIPETVRRLCDGIECQVPTQSIVAGDEVRVMPAERLPLDGRLLSDSALLDQQIITGESDPVLKQTGDLVFGGSMNGDQEIRLQVSTAANEGTVQRIIDAVQQAAITKNRYQHLADRAAQWFVPLVMLLAVCLFLWHVWQGSFQHGLMTALSIVLIACPCAMAIATPLAAWNALGEAAKRGVLFRNSEALLQLADVQTVFFDKTGTLTTGRLRNDPPQLLDAATDMAMLNCVTMSLASSSRHPVCEVLNKQQSSTVDTLPLTNVQLVRGQGMQATLPNGDLAAIGKASFVARSIAVPQSPERYPAKVTPAFTAATDEFECYVGWNGKIRGHYSVQEQLRPGIPSLLAALQNRHCRVVVLTGDRLERAQCIQRQLQVDVVGGLLPDDKLRRVRQEQSNRTVVAFVGDGVNDAAALAASDVGIAMGCGADVTREAASVCLLGSDLQVLPRLIDLAQVTRKTIRHNLVWAFAYNVVGVGFAVSGHLNPILAALAMVGSSLYVITNSLRLGSLADKLWNSGDPQAGADGIESEFSTFGSIETADQPYAAGITP